MKFGQKIKNGNHGHPYDKFLLENGCAPKMGRAQTGTGKSFQ